MGSLPPPKGSICAPPRLLLRVGALTEVSIYTTAGPAACTKSAKSGKPRTATAAVGPAAGVVAAAVALATAVGAATLTPCCKAAKPPTPAAAAITAKLAP